MTICKVIARLETQRGVRRFHRSSRFVQLTEEGCSIASIASQLIEPLEPVEAVGKRAPTAHLRINACPASRSIVLLR
ncbi:hypothetical protein GHK63_12350 [Sinorhizobium meliloti]|nr:hypothetical protein [Sinorhizobium meliloti]